MFDTETFDGIIDVVCKRLKPSDIDSLDLRPSIAPWTSCIISALTLRGITITFSPITAQSNFTMTKGTS